MQHLAADSVDGGEARYGALAGEIAKRDRIMSRPVRELERVMKRIASRTA